MPEIGRTGLAEFSGQIHEDFKRELRGKDAYKRYDEMRRNSPVIGGMIVAIENSVRQVDWEFHSEEGEEDPRLEFLNTNFSVMTHNMNDHVIEALTMLPFGYSIFELVYQRLGGQVFWRKFAFRGQDTVEQWRFDDKGGLAGFLQRTTTPVSSAEIPIEKMILYRTKVEKNNPEGWSILRTSWIPYYFHKHIQQIEAIGIERDLAGLPTIELPDGATTGDAADTDSSVANKMVRNVRNDEQAGLVLPAGWIFKLQSTGGARAFDTDKIVRRYESRMLMAALAQFLLLGQDGVGSLALSKDQTDFFTMAINATADIIGETLTKYAVPRLLRLNGMDSAGITLGHSAAGDVDLSALSDFLQKVDPMLTWLPEDEVWLRQTANLPDVDIEILREEREAKALQRQAFQQAIRGGQSRAEDERQKEQSDDEDQDDMSIFYQSDLALDDQERTKMEARWQRAFRKFFKEQSKRVERAVRSIRRG
jgi:hypothetical protein